MLVPLHQHGVQRPVEILTRADAGRLERRQRVEHGAGADRDASGAQGAREIDDVLRQPAIGCRRAHSAALSSARTSSSSSLALVPSMRAMSSWYLSRTPSVSVTIEGSSATTSSSAKAAAQSRV